MFVVGITGTKGKTTTSNLLAHILNESGRKAGMATTVNFRIGDRVWTNETKQTMLGRFALQKLLARMRAEKCAYAIVETSSEGILQYRHTFIDYSMAVFTNLSPEHIERHKGFENYRAAKVKLFEKVAKKKNSVGIFNLDDENVSYFLAPPVSKKSGFLWKGGGAPASVAAHRITEVSCRVDKTAFSLDGQPYEMSLIGEFNVYNAAAAICASLELGVSPEEARAALATAHSVPGRMEIIKSPKGFTVVVDYSYEPTGLTNALSTLRLFNPSRVICVVGSAGGGRDVWRRPVMGDIAARLADVAIITTDDPYDEDPAAIADAVYEGAKKAGTREEGKTLKKIVDRRSALAAAFSMAAPGDVVLAAGKGGEKWMNVKNGKIPWDETEIIKELLRS